MLKFLATVALLACLPLVAADRTHLTIHVTNDNSKPIGNASVIVKFKHGLNPVKLSKIQTSWELRTSQEGIAKIPSIPKGKVLVQVIAKNYQTFGDTFDVTEDDHTIEIKLNPPQAQYSAH
jgi:Carboxypeptidase regulatory-like domain